MADNRYQPGDLVPLEATFRNSSGAATNPTAVTLTIRSPDGTVTTPTPSNTATGVYHYDYAIPSNAAAGVWDYRFAGTGTVTATEQDTFVVDSLRTGTLGLLSTRALVSLADARDYVLNDVTDNTQDTRLANRINAYSEAVYKYTGREWLPVTVGATRTFWYPGYGMLSLKPYDLRSATTIKAFTDYPTTNQITLTAGTTTVLGEYRLPVDPLTNTIRWVDFGDTPYHYPSGLPFTDVVPFGMQQSRYQFSITGDWGIGTVPDDVKLAVLVAVSDSVRNPEGAASRTFGELTLNEPIDDLPAEAIWRALPGESRALLTPYVDTAHVAVG